MTVKKDQYVGSASRERDGDIAILAAHLLAKLAREAGYPEAHLSPAALAKLEAYPFPGNVRELENILRACPKKLS